MNKKFFLFVTASGLLSNNLSGMQEKQFRSLLLSGALPGRPIVISKNGCCGNCGERLGKKEKSKVSVNSEKKTTDTSLLNSLSRSDLTILGKIMNSNYGHDLHLAVNLRSSLRYYAELQKNSPKTTIEEIFSNYCSRYSTMSEEARQVLCQITNLAVAEYEADNVDKGDVVLGEYRNKIISLLNPAS